MGSDFIVRRGRGLDPMTLAWLMGTLQIGPGIGDVHFVCGVDTQYYSWLRDDLRMPVSQIHHTVTAAEDACVASRNDVVLVYPGAYDEAAEIDWDKAQTHLVGLGGPNAWGDYSEPAVCIYTDTTAVAQVLDVTGQNCQFHNFVVGNFGNNTGNLAALKLNKYGCYFKNVGFHGCNTAGSDGVTAAAALYIHDNGSYPVFDDCVIGQNCWDIRTAANSGILRFTGSSAGGSGPWNGTFNRCKFLSRAETATVAIVALPQNYSCQGVWTFNDCLFSNFWTNHADNLNQVFYDNDGATHSIVLHNCTAVGVDEWQDADAGNNWIGADMPIVGVGGGLVANPTAVTGS